MNLGLNNKYAIITGGSHGIGRSIALTLAKEGCNIAFCARDVKHINAVIQEIQDLGVQAIGLKADVMDKKNLNAFFDKILKTWGTVHILINNVGGGGRWGEESVEKTSESVWTDVYTKNALTTIRCTIRLLPYMRKQKWGRVITISSMLGREGGGRPWFNMAKSAEISLMKTLSMNPDLARDGLTFNSVAPGSIMIPETGWEKEQKENPKAFKKIIEQLPFGRMGTPEEVASVVVFLCSERASLVNGACIAVDGGESHSF